jgi:hypothetical protein
MTTAQLEGDPASRDDALRDTMRARYPDGRMPHGDKARLAREFNVTASTVSKIARSLQITQVIGRGPIRRLGAQQ